MSNEDADKLRATIEKAEMEYAVGRYEGEGPDGLYEVTAVPSSFLIDRAGELVWSGHPMGLTEAMIERALE